MAGFFEILVAHHKKNKQREANFDFFKACMAAAALMAAADGIVSRTEDAALKVMIKTLKELKLYQPGHGLELYDGFLETITNNRDRGTKDAMTAIAAVKNNADWVTLLIAICGTMSEADGVVVDEEAEIINRISDMLGLDPNVVHSMNIDVRDELYK